MRNRTSTSRPRADIEGRSTGRSTVTSATEVLCPATSRGCHAAPTPGRARGTSLQPEAQVEAAASDPEGSSITTWPWYPVVFAAAYVLNLWVESGVSIFAVTRSLAVAVLATGAMLLVLTLATRRPHLAGAVTLVVSALLVS